MQKMGLHAIYAKPKTTTPCHEHKVYPYLLREVQVSRPEQVWCGRHHIHPDETRIHVPRGNYGLVQPLCRRLGDIQSLDGQFCLDCLHQAMKSGQHVSKVI